MRHDPFGNPLHVRMHHKHGAYWYVYDNKWQPLGKNYVSAMRSYAAWVAPSGGMAELIESTFRWYAGRVKSGDLSQRSLTQYATVRGRIDNAFVEFAPAQVKAKHIHSFLDFYFYDDGAVSVGNLALSVLRGIFDRAVRHGECEYNPARQVKWSKPKKRDRYITDAEYTAIRDVSPHWLQVIMDMCYLTAQRIGDVLDIKQDDITDAGIAFQQQKTKKRLMVEASPALTALVAEARGINRIQGLYLFCHKSARHPRNYDTVRLAWREATINAGVDNANIHDLRAKSLTDADAQGLNAQKLAGHSSAQMTERYLRLLRTDRVQSPAFLRHV